MTRTAYDVISTFPVYEITFNILHEPSTSHRHGLATTAETNPGERVSSFPSKLVFIQNSMLIMLAFVFTVFSVLVEK